MSQLSITYAGIDYLDRTRALADGTVKPVGVDFRFIPAPPGELFRRVAQYDEFDAAEMSTSTYMNLLTSGDDRYVAIPVFPSRNFRHGYIWIHADSGIREPSDLRGKKVGIPEYQMTAGLWQRAALKDDFGVNWEDLHWFQGGLITPGYIERHAIPDPPGVKINYIPEEKCLEGMVADGELDALFSPQAPPGFYDGAGRVKRLFPNSVEVEQEYYRRTGLFPIMHLVVVRRTLYEANRWVALSLFEAFRRAQQIGWQRLRTTGTLSVMLPWLPRELEEISAVMGPAHWPYGFTENYRILTYMCEQSHKQGLSDRLLKPEDLFVVETHAPTMSA